MIWDQQYERDRLTDDAQDYCQCPKSQTRNPAPTCPPVLWRKAHPQPEADEPQAQPPAEKS